MPPSSMLIPSSAAAVSTSETLLHTPWSVLAPPDTHTHTIHTLTLSRYTHSHDTHTHNTHTHALTIHTLTLTIHTLTLTHTQYTHSHSHDTHTLLQDEAMLSLRVMYELSVSSFEWLYSLELN